MWDEFCILHMKLVHYSRLISLLALKIKSIRLKKRFFSFFLYQNDKATSFIFSNVIISIFLFVIYATAVVLLLLFSLL